jgi:hypothetical protein
MGSTGAFGPPDRQLTAALAVPRKVAKEVQSLRWHCVAIVQGYRSLPNPPSRAADESRQSTARLGRRRVLKLV